MYEIGTALAQQEGIGIREGFSGGDSVGEPVETNINGKSAYHLSRFVVNGLAIRREDIPHHNAPISIFLKGFYPIGTVEEFGNEVPVHRVILVIVGALVLCRDAIAVIIGISREILAFLFVIERFERDAAAIEFRVGFQDLAAILKHLIRFVEIVFYDS